MYEGLCYISPSTYPSGSVIEFLSGFLPPPDCSLLIREKIAKLLHDTSTNSTAVQIYGWWISLHIIHKRDICDEPNILKLCANGLTIGRHSFKVWYNLVTVYGTRYPSIYIHRRHTVMLFGQTEYQIIYFYPYPSIYIKALR